MLPEMLVRHCVDQSESSLSQFLACLLQSSILLILHTGRTFGLHHAEGKAARHGRSSLPPLHSSITPQPW